ncbi:2'-5'-oligoadenylate synthase 2-like [Branchiostoma lanceolatum]|uniref:2'-5'-oligoadenylate synthase 2-like n=1 Tax=Branchiostoma lanceolatum TaxID=7740 RepID=UPI0034567A7E
MSKWFAWQGNGHACAIKSKSDIDCVLFTSNLPSMDSYDYKRQLELHLKWAEIELRESSSSIANNPEVLGRTSHAVKLRVNRSDHASHDVDLRLARDLLGENPSREKKAALYAMMDKLSSSVRENCSAALPELQRDFVRKQPAEVKDLIRLVKMWRNQPDALPTGASVHRQSDYRSINAFSVENYSYTRMLEMTSLRPHILDPANPHNNVADRCKDWPAVALAAQETLRKQFFPRY